ncbi:hypothetical protein DESC_590100 [Desulfosarcina cetonica]|uniref:hypothetical protein n=1 Tax=Desulfosarcina cetonica TaxID=90730 RepID=UPI0006D182C3|nr:hypothetical protein [Desulfosarcina cetonica]VTR67185.1 hypothetical protein DESC_590100 [Desulfosarcina cetonica]
MQDYRNQRFWVSSLGPLYRISLERFAHHLENTDGKPLRVDDLAVDQPFFVFFESGTGLTRTSATRIA